MSRLFTKVTFIICISILAQAAHAEYRAYQYIIKNKISSSQVGKPLIKKSTLDPVSFLAYNGGGQGIEIDLLRTWICPGNTSKKKICDSPYRKISNLGALDVKK